MIFGIFILVLAAGVAFFHYVQGFFSSMISMILVIISAALALGFHENLAGMLFKSFAVAQGHSISLVLIFAASYVVLRILFDKLVPGNIQIPVIADKVGAGVFGLIAGVFAGGVLAIAGQALPFGPSIGGYARFELQDRVAQGVTVAGQRQRQDLPINEELKLDDLSASDINSLFAADSGRSNSLAIAVDEWTVGLVSHLSDGGSLAGERSFASVHPAYLNELFAQRTGVQVGAKRVLPDPDGSALKFEQAVTAPDLMRYIKSTDLEMPEVRGKGRLDVSKLPEGDALVIRIRPGGAGADSDGFIRFSPATVRLVSSAADEGQAARMPVEYRPIGTLADGNTLSRNLPDDPLFLKSGRAVDLVFAVEARRLIVKGEGGKGPVFPQGSFIELKRVAKADLSGKPLTIASSVDTKEEVGVLKRGAANP